MDAEASGCFLPMPRVAGGWTSSKMDAWSATLWLREILVTGGLPRDAAATVSSHSLKATVLSWCAKADLPVSVRRLLGGHVSRSEKSVAICSRDALGGPLLQLDRLLDRVAKGDFLPDVTRSGRWVDHIVKRKFDGFLPDRSIVSLGRDSNAFAVSTRSPKMWWRA